VIEMRGQLNEHEFVNCRRDDCEQKIKAKPGPFRLLFT